MDLDELGFTPRLAEALRPYAEKGLAAGRVAAVHTHVFRILTAAGERLAKVSGRFRHAAGGPADFPAVGDWVAVRERGGTRATIHALLPRKSRFSRKVAGAVTAEQVVAANVDTVFLVAGLDGDFNPRRLERALVLVRESGALPVIVLNKADLCAETSSRRGEAEAAGAPVVVLSARTGFGMEALVPHLRPGATVALIGSSGVGKSTLVNRLLGVDARRTAEVRTGDDRGRHTTSDRQLLLLPGGAMIIDTPGLREIQLWGAGEGLGAVFSDLAAVAEHCRFRDCRHDEEPGCAVRPAVEKGELEAERLASWRKLEAERRHLAARHDERLREAEKRRTKSIHRAARRHRPRE